VDGELATDVMSGAHGRGCKWGFAGGVLARLVGGYESHPSFIPPHSGTGIPNEGGNGLYLRPLVAMPWMKAFWAKKNTMITGAITRRVAAMRRFQGVPPCCDWYAWRPRESVKVL
jgi:hypothetical protein